MAEGACRATGPQVRGCRGLQGHPQEGCRAKRGGRRATGEFGAARKEEYQKGQNNRYWEFMRKAYVTKKRGV